MPAASNPLKNLTRSRSHAEADRAVEEARKDETVRFNMNMARAMHQELKIRAVREGRDMKDIVEELLRDYLKKP